MTKLKTHQIVHIAILSSLSVMLMFFDFPVPFLPPFLKLDASDAVIFVSSVFVGPWGMMGIIVLRSFLHWLLRGAETGIPVGQLATIISSTVFCLSAYFVAQKTHLVKEPRQKIMLGLIVGTIVMTIIMFIMNYLWVTPFYFALAQWPIPENYFEYMLVYLPFNLIKGLLNSTLIYFLLPYMLRTQTCKNL